MPSTITYITAELLAAGVVTDLGSFPKRDSGGPGRRSTRLDILPNGGFAVGVHIGVQAVSAAITDLKGQVLSLDRVQVDFDLTPADVVEQVAASVTSLIARSGIERGRVVGVGVGVVGWIDPEEGIVRRAPHRGWEDVPLRSLMSRRLGLPVVIERNVRAMAVAEKWFGHAAGAQNLILVIHGTVLGAGLIVGGQIVQGKSHLAGQIGHIQVRADGPVCSCGKVGCLDAVASDAAMLQRALAWAVEYPNSRLADLLKTSDFAERVQGLFAAAVEGDVMAREIVTDSARAVATALAPIVAALDPEAIIVVGGITSTRETYFTPLQSTLRDAIGDERRGIPFTVAPSALNPRMQPWYLPVIGGASLALKSFYTA
ncbi:MAG TPA: ROK family protein, partial [Chloroflexota bacterium]|nr:ROK family protein [Chloroflexota bacterium]